MHARIGGERARVSALPRSLQTVVSAGLGPRDTINWAELNHMLSGALAAIEASAGGVFSKARADTEVDASVARTASKRSAAALALFELVVDRERRKRSFAPLLAAQRTRLLNECGDAGSPTQPAQTELRRLFSLPLDHCLREAAALFRNAGAQLPADELERLAVRLASHPDEVTGIAVRARAIMLTHAPAMSDRSAAAAAAVRELERAGSTLPELEASL